MANTIEVKVPDIGGHDGVPVIEVMVKVGDTVAKEQSLVTLESDKATMEVPSTAAGVVKAMKLKVGDEVSEGDVILVLEVAGAAAVPTPAPAPASASAPAPAAPRPAPVPAASAPAPQAATASGRKADIECALVVLGSGPGGYSAAFRAADLGLDTVLVERYGTLGGVCLNVGCIPSKALLHAAAVIDEAEAMAAHGVTFGKPKLDIDKLRDFKNKVVGQLTGGLGSMAKQRKVRTVQGTGAFVSPHEMEVQTAEGTRLIRFEQAIIAAGSQSVKLPAFPWDNPRVVDSTGALELKDVPGKLLVVGGGII
ncbi:MAG TPA: FAD-dependent oxidoreductase, partial [Rhodanobacter sp.]|nr:FAD-dependent oxidoreductase [Rhodanobacter sp.]